MRGGLDDALEKLARRDELRRRAEGGGIGTPPAVQDLVEAIAAVVGRNPGLAVTVGVEGAGDPVLLHFAVEDGIVQVSADNAVASRVAEAAPTSPRHADFDVDLDDPVEESYPYSAAPASDTGDTGQATRRIDYDDPYRSATPPYAGEPVANHRRHDSWDDGRSRGPASQPFGGSSSVFDAAAMRSHPFASSSSPLFEEPAAPQFGGPASAMSAEATRRIHADHRHAPKEQPASDRPAGNRPAEQRIMPTPLPEPVPLKVDTEETELAARRLAALLRDNPSLLRRSSPD